MTAPYRTPWEPPAERRRVGLVLRRARVVGTMAATALVLVPLAAVLTLAVAILRAVREWALDLPDVMRGLRHAIRAEWRAAGDNDTPAASGTRASNEGGE